MISIILGFIFPSVFEGQIKKLIQSLAEQVKGLNFIELFIFIFTNNLKTAFLGMILGLIIIIPIFYCLFNGYVLGFVANLVSKEQGFSSLWRILPHGVFEIPALFLSLALGLRLGMFLFAKKKKLYLKENLSSSLRVFVYVIIPLLLIAGLIETCLIVFLAS